MSHIVTIRTQLRDPAALSAACQRLGIDPPTQGTAQLYSGTASGWIVNLPGWHYPAVFDAATGEAKFDNFEGHWGEPAQLDKLLQAYAVEKAKLEARRAGHSVTEQLMTDGSIKLTVQAGAPLADVQSLISLIANSNGSGSLTAVPEPTSFVLFGLGLLGMTSAVGNNRWIRNRAG